MEFFEIKSTCLSDFHWQSITLSAMHSKKFSDRIYAEGYSARKSHEYINNQWATKNVSKAKKKIPRL
jgi:hypothetical protein